MEFRYEYEIQLNSHVGGYDCFDGVQYIGERLIAYYFQ